MKSPASLATSLLAALWLLGCAGYAAKPTAPMTAQVVRAEASAFPAGPADDGSSDDTRRLEELWRKRTRETGGSDFTLGPGDVLDISVPLEELEHREVRVSPQDTIELPLAGVVPVRGMDEQGLTEALRDRLSKYMYDPPISLFVKHYGSREVAVVGAVQKPGLYTLTSSSDTLMDMLDRAGGMTTEAASRIVFLPAGAGGATLVRSGLFGAGPGPGGHAYPHGADSHHGGANAPQAPEQPTRGGAAAESTMDGAVRPIEGTAAHPQRAGNPLGGAIARLRPITISMAGADTQQYLEMPARPGDALIIPVAGEVTVGGWVHTPGAYKITSGMTGLGSISAAGGPLFSSSAEILRTMSNGQRVSIPIDIAKVQSGEQPDVPVQSGDVVMVDPSAAGAVPYAMYEVFTKFGAGMMIPIP